MGLGLTRVGSCAGVYGLVEGVDAIGWRLWSESLVVEVVSIDKVLSARECGGLIVE